ncbi:FadR/GntR family transcriptional regulator [Paracoccus nototheniae]|uniref:FadR/GntR family transcriptional regulator n=1 Tax=Paracoccus nototheniae TaxID=2489002 RepID=A0ABW4DZG8_9RHOB|nr:FCD domain-containing protein [Paracoccus nototheniae]
MTLLPDDDLPFAPTGHATSTFALDRLRGYIQAQGEQSGARLPTERQLSDRMGVGRRAIRRALEVLEAEGRITRRQGAGTFIGPATPVDDDPLAGSTDFLEIMEVRLRLEPQLAALAALRAKPAQIARMYELSDRIAQSLDADEGELWDGALHRQIAQAGGNTLFLSLFDIVNRVRRDEAWQAVRERARGGLPGHALPVAQHRAIIDAIAARDPTGAADQMRTHLFMLQEKLIRLGSAEADHAANIVPGQPAEA